MVMVNYSSNVFFKMWIDVPSTILTILGLADFFFCRMKSDKIDFSGTHGLQASLAISSFLGVPSHSLGFPCERHLMQGKNEVKNEVPTCTYAGRTVLHQVAKQCPIVEK